MAMFYDLGLIWVIYGILLLALKMEPSHQVQSGKSMLVKLLSLGAVIGCCFLLGYLVIKVFWEIGRDCGVPIPWLKAITFPIFYVAYVLLPPIGYLYYANQHALV